MADYVQDVTRARFPIGLPLGDYIIPWQPRRWSCIPRPKRESKPEPKREKTWEELAHEEADDEDEESDDEDDDYYDDYYDDWPYGDVVYVLDAPQSVLKKGVDYEFYYEAYVSSLAIESANYDEAVLASIERGDLIENRGVALNQSKDEDTDSDSDDDFTPCAAFIDDDSDDEFRPCAAVDDDDDDDTSFQITTANADSARDATKKAIITLTEVFPTETTEKRTQIASPQNNEDSHFPDFLKMSSDVPSINMMDSDLLSDLVKSNLKAPEITSIIIFGTNGAISAHASSTSTLRDLRRLAATCGSTYSAFQQPPATNTTATSTTAAPDHGDTSKLFLEFEANTVLVTRITSTTLLGVAGPQSISNGQQQQQPTLNGNIVGISSESIESNESQEDNENQANGVDSASDGEESKAQHDNDRPSQDVATHASPAVLEALERKSEALAGYLRGIMGDIGGVGGD